MFDHDGEVQVDYEPAESDPRVRRQLELARAGLDADQFLLIESLYEFQHATGRDFKVECPTGSGKMLTSPEICGRTLGRQNCLFLCCAGRRRPTMGGTLLRAIRIFAI